MPGIWSKLGALASQVFKTVRETSQTLAEAITFWKPHTEGVSVSEAEREYGQVSISEGQKDILAQVDANLTIPRSLHDPAPLNFKREFTYTVSIYGRGVAGRPDGKGGQFVHDEFYITTSRAMTPAEVMSIATERFGKYGAYAMLDIFSMNLSNAYIRQ